MWTSPRTWVTSELVTASLLNTHIRDNLLETAPAKLTVAGDLPYATAANTLARLAKGTALQGLRMNAGATAPEWATVPTVVVKAANQVINNIDTLQNDDELLIAVGASETWIFDLSIIYASAVANQPNLAVAMSYPSGSGISAGVIGVATTGGVLAAQVLVSKVGVFADTNVRICTIQGSVSTGTVGNIQFRWCHNSAYANNLTVYAQSWMRGWRVT